MRGLKIPVLIVVALSFAFGVLWGLKIRHDHASSSGQRLNSKNRISILAFKGLLSAQWMQRFEMDTGIGIELMEAKDPEDLEIKIQASSEKNPVDIVSFYSSQLARLHALDQLQPVDLSKLSNGSNVSTDFLDLPGEMSLRSSVPTHWGLTGFAINTTNFSTLPHSWREISEAAELMQKTCLLGSTAEFFRLTTSTGTQTSKWAQAKVSTEFSTVTPLEGSRAICTIAQVSLGEMAFPPFDGSQWKFVSPSEKLSLWILAWSTTRQTRDQAAAKIFLNYILAPKSARSLSENLRASSTNRTLEESELDARLKPSYLRQIPLDQFVLLSEPANDNDGIAIHKWIEEINKR
jgi:spermidine/putrescine-binding protein